MAEVDAGRRTVLVTGASSGLGRATALLLAQRFRVFGTSRRAVDDYDGVEMLCLDVRDRDSVSRCVEQVLSKSGRLDVLVNNAGVMHEGFAEETTAQQAHAVFETNFFGTTEVINAVLPHMRRNRRGMIINIGSLAAWVGEPGEAFYSASKAALARYTEALRHEVWHLGISVCLVEPGVFKTNVLEAASNAEHLIGDYDGTRETARRTLHEGLRNGDDPRTVAATVLAIVESPFPRRRYGVGRQARWLPLLTSLMPQRLFDRLLRRGLGLRG